MRNMSFTTFVRLLFTTKDLDAGLEFPAVQRVERARGGRSDFHFQPGHRAEFAAWRPQIASKKEAT
jgi:hypothetical protein